MPYMLDTSVGISSRAAQDVSFFTTTFNSFAVDADRRYEADLLTTETKEAEWDFYFYTQGINAIAAPVTGAGYIPFKDVGNSTVAGALGGASVGASFGPYGAAAGAIIGGVLGSGVLGGE